ncbi:WYL domain-containing protein [uncultured Brachyspira sp.]|uniref:WYL domain-containing protein n=1 Tax=uncultured Brachyspira sp. TaxID=221953 RepID=UPI0026359448|nr:WYL domain-containing protein [uncultured Brachyspira sp.]
MSDKKKFERLFELYSSLILDGFIDKNKFMDSNNMSLRTLQRDIEEIQKYLQIELILENDRYTLKKEYLKKLKKWFNFDNDNLKKNVDILFSVFMKKVSSNLSLIPHSTVSKLLPQNVDNEYYDIIVISNNEINNIAGDSENIEKLLSCVKDLNDISFDYYIQSSNINYKVKAIAYLIYYFQGIWYLVAYDHKHKKIKTYSISNISKIEIIQKLKFNNNKEKEEYQKEHKNRIESREKLIKLIEKKRSIYWSDNKLTKTTIHFNSEVAHYFKNRDYGFNQKIKKELEDCSIIVNFDFSSFTELRIFLSPWLGSFKIISPEKFNKEFIEHLNKSLSIMNE